MPSSSGLPSLERAPGKHDNWVEDVGGLPKYIDRIARHLHSEKGMDIGRAIAVAVNACKRMCASGDLNYKGKQNVNAKSRAEACAAVAEWEAKKAKAHVTKGQRVWLTDDEFADLAKNITVMSDEEFDRHVAEADIDKRFFSADKRKEMAASGEAMTGGRYPIASAKDVKNAVMDWYRTGKDPSVKEHIISRAKALGCMDALPDDWTVSKSYEFTIQKRDDEQQLVFGWASVAIDKNGVVIEDRQGDLIDDPNEIEKAAYGFVLHSRDGGEMHVRKGVSTLVESFAVTPEKLRAMGFSEESLSEVPQAAWWTGWKVHDKEVWKGVKEGKYPMFSVHGKGVRKQIEEGE